MKDPAAKADYVVALDGDAVAKAVAARPLGLTLLHLLRCLVRGLRRLIRLLLRLWRLAKLLA